MNPSEFLKSLTASQLDSLIEHDIDTSEQSSEHIDLADLIYDSYPELGEFAEIVAQHMPDIEDMDQDEVLRMQATVIVALGAICRLAEIRDMPLVNPE
jgi:hypothetical protein